MTVLVGVQGPDSSRAAIRAASQEAKFRGTNVVAVTSYSGDRFAAAPASRPGTYFTTAEQRAGAEVALRDALLDALGPEASLVALQVARGVPGHNLVAAARALDAELLVLSSRPETGLSRVVDSQYVLRNAPCPLLIVPETEAAA